MGRVSILRYSLYLVEGWRRPVGASEHAATVTPRYRVGRYNQLLPFEPSDRVGPRRCRASPVLFTPFTFSISTVAAPYLAHLEPFDDFLKLLTPTQGSCLHHPHRLHHLRDTYHSHISSTLRWASRSRRRFD